MDPSHGDTSCSEDLREYQSTEVEMEGKYKDAKHRDEQGKTVSKYTMNQFFSTPTGNPSVAPETCHELSDCIRTDDRKFPGCQCSPQFIFKSCLKQHLRMNSDDRKIEKEANLNSPLFATQFKDFASWQKDYLTEEILSTQLKYWKDKLTGYETLNLITDFSRPSQRNNAGHVIYFKLDEKVSIDLRTLAKELNVNLHTVLLSGYFLMLRSYSNQDDIVIGTPLANKHYRSIDNLIGFFVSTLAIRIQINSTCLLKDFIKQIGGDIITGQKHQDVPFEKLVEEIAVAKDTTRHPIFQIMFGLKNFDPGLQSQTYEETDLADLLKPYEGRSPRNLANCMFDLITVIDDSGTELKGVFNYATSLYKKETIDRFIETYVQILRQFSNLVTDQIKKEHMSIADLSYLNAEQYHQIIHNFNVTDKEYPAHKTIHQLFEEQVEKSSDNIAVIYENVKLTYRELNTRANQLANYLIKEYNIEPDDLISLCLDRSENMIIAILAVLKSGGAYVPIDPSYPDERIHCILDDTSSRLLLTNEVHQRKLEGVSCLDTNQKCLKAGKPISILSIDSHKFQDKLLLQDVTNPNIMTTSNRLAYVMHTSGTTGEPKGVMVEHRGLVNLNFNLISEYEIGDDDDREVILQFANYVFSASVSQILLGILNGHVLLLIPNQLWLDAKKFYNYLFVNKVTHILATPTFLEAYDFSEILSLKRLVVAGELLSLQSYNNIRLNDKIKIIIAYGLTETLLLSTANVVGNGNPNVGSPVSNTRCYVLNDNLRPLPIGAVGGLHIGGVGVARGYLNRPDLTSERFIANPFQTEKERRSGKNARLHKTGDLVRWLPDGKLEYIGRKDFQVNIRGYRIELGEIERALSGYKGIKQSVPLAKENKTAPNKSPSFKYLVGYYVSDTKLDEAAILRYLESKLPEYMVPVILVHLNELPLTISGKLDRKALPDPVFTHLDNYVAPRNQIEKKVCHIWAKVLGLTADKVGIHDDFFKLGGNSIMSIHLVSRLRKSLQLNINVNDIFNNTSIARLYENVLKKELGTDKLPSLQAEQGILVGAVPLLPIQEWFFRQNFSIPHDWNKSLLIKTPELDLGTLKDSLEKLVQHHDSFRLRYRRDENRNIYEQFYDGSHKAEPIKVCDVKVLGYPENCQAFKSNLCELLTKWQANFDLLDGPMYSVGYLHGYQDGSARIYLALHHLIVDAASLRILSEDLRNIYYGKSLGKKGSSYRQWARIVKDIPRKHQNEELYWNNILSDYDGSLLNNFKASDPTGYYTNVELSQKYTFLLLQECNQAYNTQINDLLLTALGFCFKKMTGCNILHVVLVGHGREEIDSSIDITRTLGWFTTIYPVRLEISDSLETSIRSVKEYIRAIPNKGLGFRPRVEYELNVLPKISFNYLEQFGKKSSEKLNDKDLWRITEEYCEISMIPNNWETNIVNINGLITEGRLRLSIDSKLDKETTNDLARIFQEQVEAVIDHTINQPRSYLTVSDVGHIISTERLDALQEQQEIEAIYLANSLQQGFIYHALSQGDVDDAYVIQSLCHYRYSLNISHLKDAWKYAIDKFSCLRLRFDWQEDLVQIIDKECCLDWRYKDLSDELILEKQEKIIKDIQEKDRIERYDLAKGNLIRIYLIKQSRDLYSCILSNHHAILDGWSMPILLEYVHDTYLEIDRKELIKVQPDYAYSLAQRFLQEHQEDHKAYWDTYIAQVEERGDFSGLLLKHEKKLSDYKHILHPTNEVLAITGSLYDSLKFLSQEEGVTLNALLQYVWHKVLSVYGNTKQTIVGTTVSGRSLPVDDIEKSVGLYINTLPLIVNHQASKRLIDSIKDVQSCISELNSRSNINLVKLQPSGERLFDSLFVYQNYPNRANLVQDKGKPKFKVSVGKLDYPLTVTAYEANNELVFNLQYAGELFSMDAINNLLHLTRTLLEQLASCAHQTVTSLNFLDAQRYDQIIHGWNATDKEYPANKTIHGVFEEQATKTPDNLAIVYDKVQLSYRQLNERANQLALYLVEGYNLKPDSLVTLCLDRSELMIIAILAVLKSGGAYVPIDPKYPDERIRLILEDTCATLLLTNEAYQERLAGIDCLRNTNQECLESTQPLSILPIDSKKFKDILLLQAVTNPNTLTTSKHLAYVIYTSGTTGKPKGVMVEHTGLVNLNYDLINRYRFDYANGGEVILQLSNYVFDVSPFEIILGLLNGYVLLLVPNQMWLDDEKFNNYLLVNKVTHIHSTPRFLEQHNFGNIFSLKRLESSGENLSEYSYVKIRLNDEILIINSYGPTETSMATTNIIKEGNINIGFPISNIKCYVLDDNRIPLPVGAVGNLYIGGVSLARGYLKRPDLTDERFVVNPFQTNEENRLQKNSRLYKTGDLVTWLPDGSLKYIGRTDFQVKIRGYRIELGEIENALLGFEGIKQSVALAKEYKNAPSTSSGFKYIIGYYVSDSKLDEEAILRYLESKLPEYMVPVMLLHMHELPLTINRKLDRNALPDPEFILPDNYVAPRNEIEEKTCQIWAEVLGLNAAKVGTRDDFFRLGGDSILSIQMVSRLRKKLQLNVSVRDILSYKSIGKLYENVFSKALSGDKLSSLQTEQGILVGAVPLLPVQEWFFWNNFGAANHWNQSFLIRTPTLDLDKLQDSLEKLVQHHDSFRLRFKKNEKCSTWEQYYDGYAELKPLHVLDVCTLGFPENHRAFKTKLHEVLTNWQSNFDVLDGPMYCVGYIYGFKDGSARIYFALHHLIVDAVSLHILCEDLRDIYDGKTLGIKGSSYRQWAKAVRDYPRKHQDEKLYWNNISSDHEETKLNKLIVSETTANYANVNISEEYTALLLQECNQAYNTQISDLLLTALGYSLKQITGCNINHIALEGQGREDVENSLDITRTLGWFTTIYPITLEISDSLGTSIRAIKEYLRAIPNNGLGYGPILGYELYALPKISFSYVGEFGNKNSGKINGEDFWEITHDDSAISTNTKTYNTNVININGVITKGRLRFSIVSKLDEETTNDLARVFQDQVEVVINHTINQPRSYLTVSDVGHIISKEILDALQEQREIKSLYLANSLQQGFIYRALREGDLDDAYIIQFFWQYHYSINIKHIKQAWKYAIKKFSSLRLRFDWQEELVQIIDKEGSLVWHYIDLSDESSTEKQENTIRDIQGKDRLERFDLAMGSLFRIYVIKQNWDLYSCMLSAHHAILDGWSLPILLEYVDDTYLRLDRKELIIVQPDDAYEMAQRYIQEHQEDHKAYWDTYIAQVEERGDFNGLLLSNEKKLREYKHILHPTDETLAITGSLYDSLKFLSQEEGVTLNALLQYVWHKVLSVYRNSKQTIVGTTLSGRCLPVEDIEKSVGLYINTLPLIVNHNAKKRLIDSIQDVQSCISELNSRSNISLVKLQSSGERIFDSLFVYQNFPKRINLLRSRDKPKFKGSVKKLDYPLTVTAYEAHNELVLNFQYAGELISKDAVNNLLHLTRTLLEQLPGCAHEAATSLSYLNAQRYDQIIHGWNATDKEYPANKTIHELFEEQVAKTPDNVAIVYENVQLTYSELNEGANRLASFLISEFNIVPDSLIPLCFDRSEHMMIAILGVLKSGGAYVPIDPSYPDERIRFILQDTGTTLLLTNETYQERLEGIVCLNNTNQECLEARHPLSILPIDSQQFKNRLLLQALTNPNTFTTSSNLVYVLYTSGTTGKPKGVMLEHRGLVNLNYDLINRYGFNEANGGEVILQLTNYVFDVSVHEIILGLLNGYVLLLVPNQMWLDEEKFNSYLVVNKVSYIHSTPRFFEQHNFGKISSLKILESTGEVLSEQLYDSMKFKDAILIINSYGPTETSVIATVNIVKEGNISIGSPISNTKCYVLDDNLIPLPVGAVGNLYIGGVGLARGYLNRPDLTSERFIANPLQTQEEKRSLKNARLYKTGDLVRWLPEGGLEYIGRTDFQVKIRGYRIELGEIESALLGFEGIKQSVALAKEYKNAPSTSSGFKYIIVYYVSDSKLDEEAILRYLESKLPEYMVPLMVVRIDELPLTINGKLDRKALPDPEFIQPDNYVTPRNETEEKTCQIWAEVLGLNAEKIGIRDDFFRLGGDSIKSIQIVSRLRKRLQLNVSVRDIFRFKCIARLYENVFSKELRVDSLSSLQTEQGILVGAVPLLPVQVWFFWNNFCAAHHWNQSFLIKTPRLDLGKLQDSLEKLFQHHDSFRLRFKKNERSNTWEQYYDGYAEVEPVKVLDICTLRHAENSQTFKSNLRELLTNWQANFDLTDGPMYSVGYVYGYKDGSARIFFALHHLIVDAVSWRLLSEDLRDIYYGKILGSKGSSYRQWAQAVRDYPRTHQEEQLYWNNILSSYDKKELYKLIVSESTVHYANIKISEEYTALLLQKCNQAYNTQINDLLLTALGYTLKQITGCSINHIAVEGHGREEIDRSIDTTRTLGWFTTIYPVMLAVSDSLSTSIMSIKECLRAIPNKGIGFGPTLMYESNSLPRITYNYLGQFAQEKSERLNNEDIWQITDEYGGISMNQNNRDNNLIIVNGRITEGRLNFNIVSKLDEETTNNLASVFKQHLLSIINHCKNNLTTVYTMSDFKDFEPYVVFYQEIVDRNTLFMFPPGHGGAESYFRNIVPGLCNKRLILFNNYFKYVKDKLGKSYAGNLTIEILAEDYITYIKLIQPKGPYNLFGWSFGGILAFEISKKLISKGDCVTNLILIDSYFDCENAALKKNSKSSQLNNIDSKYPVSLDIEMPNTNIILFKSTKVEEINFYNTFYNKNESVFSVEEMIGRRNIDKYYAKNTKANNLDKLLNNHKIKVIPMNSSHYGWVHNDDVIKEMCVRLGEL